MVNIKPILQLCQEGLAEGLEANQPDGLEPITKGAGICQVNIYKITYPYIIHFKTRFRIPRASALGEASLFRYAKQFISEAVYEIFILERCQSIQPERCTFTLSPTTFLRCLGMLAVCRKTLWSTYFTSVEGY